MKIFLRKYKHLLRLNTYREWWWMMTLSEKALLITCSVMLAVFVGSFNLYIGSKIKSLKNKAIELIIEPPIPPVESSTQMANTISTTEEPSKGEIDVETNQAFNENEEIGEGLNTEGEIDEYDESIGEELELEPFLSNSKSMIDVISLSEERVANSRKTLSGQGKILKHIRNNRNKSTIKYNLIGREALSLHTPAYTCPVGGRVVVDIIVNSLGNVLSANINKKKSSVRDDCLMKNSLEYAKKANFSPSTIPRQNGTITFVYVGK